MKTVIKTALIAVSLILVLGIKNTQAYQDHSLVNEEITSQFVTAFNQKNIKLMLSLASDNVRWAMITQEKLLVETTGQSELQSSMTRYFKQIPSAQAELLQISSHGDFVHTVEKMTWQTDNELVAQCSHAMYEFEQGQIKQVWYFSAYACD